jgi:hypothetical protein
MKKINEMIATMREVDELVGRMESEIMDLRSIVHRYYLMYGHKITSGDLDTPDNISFDVKRAEDSDGSIIAVCRKIDHDKIGLSSNHMLIKKAIRKLSERE